MPELSKEDFRQWLVAKEPDEVVGWTHKSAACPGSSWLTEQFNTKVVVDYGTVAICGAEQHGEFTCSGDIPLPQAFWLRDFGAVLDQRFDDAAEGIWDRAAVTAKQALEVLDSLDVS